MKINLNLYQTGFDNPVWSGTLKGEGSPGRVFNLCRISCYAGEKELNTALNKAIKQWYSYPGFQEAMVSLAGNVTSPQPVVQQPSVKQQVVSGGTGFLLVWSEIVPDQNPSYSKHLKIIYNHFLKN